MKCESKCLRGKFSDTTDDNKRANDHRSFLSWLPTQSTNHLDLDMVKCSLKMKNLATSNLKKKINK